MLSVLYGVQGSRVKRANPENKLAKKKAAWLERTGQVLGMSSEETKRLLSLPRAQSLRLNPLVESDTEKLLLALRGLGWQGEAYSWATYGYSVTEGLTAVRDSDLVAEGAVFIQNAASWLPVLSLDPQPGESILDVCAAPGGKTSHIAAITNNQVRITANDNSRPRLAKLRANLERLHTQVEQYTLYDAAMLARKLGGRQFDRILIDAPCSGEGLMNINRDKDFETWSVAHIKRLQQLQKRIITQAWQLLKPGGTMIYSTCTMAPEEDEAVVDYLLRSNEDAEVKPLIIELPNRIEALKGWNGRSFDPALAGSLRLAPSPNIEAFYICKIQKADH
jgi:tRNA (cytosine49-C5)-methyltransferase